MWSWYMVLSFWSALVTILICTYMALRKPRVLRGAASYKTMVVLGSGGHTAEMFKFLSTLPMDRKHVPRVYVIANSDQGSQSTMEEFERHKSPKKIRHTIRWIPRSRIVGQSYFTSIFTTLYSFIHSAMVVLQERPTVLLCNGPGTCLPIIFCAWIYRIIGIAPCAIFLLESYACVEHPSLTGKLCKSIVDRYCVQWPALLEPSRPHIVYTGRVTDFSTPDPNLIHPTISKPAASYALVTVGSTLFNSLIEAIDNPKVIDFLSRIGLTGLHVQYGKGIRPTKLKSRTDFEVVIYDYKKTGWKQEIGDAALVIGHAGAGTILDSLEALKPIIVVANDLLMSQHQSEIASLMARLGYCYHTTPGNLIKHLPGFLDKLDFLRVFPGKETSAFANEVSHFLSGGEKPNFLTKMPSKRRSLRLNNDK